LCNAKTPDCGRCVPELTLFGAAVEAIPEYSISWSIEGRKDHLTSSIPLVASYGNAIRTLLGIGMSTCPHEAEVVWRLSTHRQPGLSIGEPLESDKCKAIALEKR
jgi:hypothetical protein